MADNLHETDEHLAGYVLTQFDHWGKNRTAKQLKWEKNREAFLALYDGHWKLKDVKEWENDPVFVRAVKTKVMAAFSLAIDILLQGGKIPYQYKLSPFSERKLEELPEELAEIERAQMKEAKSRSDEQLQMTRSVRAFIKCVFSKALYGEAIAKFLIKTVTRKRRKPLAVDGLGDLSMVSRDRLQYETVEDGVESPAWGYVSVWDFFYDLEGGVHGGRGCIHRRMVNNYWMRKRMERPGYLTANIKKLLEDADSESYEFKIDETTLAPSLRNLQHRENKRQYLEYWGRVPKKRVEKFLAELEEREGDSKTLLDLTDDDGRGDEVECCVHVCDGEVVFFAYTRAADRPFELDFWEEPLDELSGVGPADNAGDMQHLLNDLIHQLVKNKRKAGTVKFAMKRRMIDGDLDNKDFENPDEQIDLAEECDNAAQAIQAVITPDVGNALMPLIDLVRVMLDEDSMIDRIMQGGSPDGDATAKQIREQVEKGGKYVATVVKNSDENHIEPMMNRFFDFNMSDPEYVQGKGDFVVEALGFTSFMDKQVKITAISNLMDMMAAHEELNRDYSISEMFAEVAKMLDTSVEQFERGEDEKAAMNQPDPLLEVQIAKEQSEIEKNQSAAALDEARVEQIAQDAVLKRAESVERIRTARKEPAGTTD